MNTLDSYFSEDNILFYLCRIRSNIAKRRNADHLIHLLSSNPKYNYHTKVILETEKEVCELFPSRKSWKRISFENRYRNGNKLNTIDVNIISLIKTIKWFKQNEPNAIFLNNLNNFISDVQKSIRDANYYIQYPIIYPKLKDPKKVTNNICRPISNFKLKDKIIICLINKYFTDLFDNYFFENSLAFRAVRVINSQKKCITHHDAIIKIKEYHNTLNTQNVWVSECDMKKFYDSVNHTIIKVQFRKLIKKVKKDKPQFYDFDAERIFYLYLDSYTFNKNVFPLNKYQSYFDNYKIPDGKFEWIKDDLIDSGKYKKINNAKIGIPQGGALSGLIANIVLDYADSKLAKYAHKDFLYLRYCDDMIIMHPDKEICTKAIKTYTSAIEKLKLIPHNFKEVNSPSKEFWKTKSKEPYLWSNQNPSSISWIGFVGYELNVNGFIRIRKSSLKREMSKQCKVIDTAKNAIKNGAKRVNNGSVVESIIHRLIGMSVGRAEMWNYKTSKNDLCWINGFLELNNNPYSFKQLKNLDRNRNKHFWSFLKELYKMKDNPDKKLKSNPNRELIYFGKPFSYFYQATKNKKNVVTKYSSTLPGHTI